MASRSYRRDSRGRFASGGGGGGGGTFVTTGKAGGFANAAFRARVAQGSVSSGRGTAASRAKGRIKARVTSAAKKGIVVAAGGTGAALATSALSGARNKRRVNKSLSLINRMDQQNRLDLLTAVGGARGAIKRRSLR